MIIAMIAVRVVQVALHEVVGVLGMRNRGVAAVIAVHVRGVVARASVVRGALGRVGGGHRERVLVEMVAMRMVEVAVMQKVGMTFVLKGGMSAAGGVYVIVLMGGMVVRVGHEFLLCNKGPVDPEVLL